jgi:hypothetical protein
MLLPSVLHSLYNTQNRMSFTLNCSLHRTLNGLSQCFDGNIDTVDVKYSVFGKLLCTYKRCWKWYPWTIVSKNWIKQLHTLPALHFNRCLTTEYSETTAHFNDNFDTNNQSTYRSLSAQRLSQCTVCGHNTQFKTTLQKMYLYYLLKIYAKQITTTCKTN